VRPLLELIGAFLLGAAAGLALSRYGPRTLRRRRNGEESVGLKTLARMVRDSKETLERVLDEVNTLSTNVARLAPAGTQERTTANPGPGMSRGGGYGAAPARMDRPEAPPSTPAWAARSGFTDPRPTAGGFGGYGEGRDPVDESQGSRAPRDAWAAIASPSAGPPANAVSVEARDDRIVASSSYPPEAWLEVSGAAEARVTLNPAVRLNEYALQRLSTFFEWEGRRPDSTYETVSPASVKWDDGARVGVLVSRGRARAR
jgi:hypothetical protein